MFLLESFIFLKENLVFHQKFERNEAEMGTETIKFMARGKAFLFLFCF
jgi:hypothetical protein